MNVVCFWSPLPSPSLSCRPWEKVHHGKNKPRKNRGKTALEKLQQLFLLAKRPNKRWLLCILPSRQSCTPWMKPCESPRENRTGKTATTFCIIDKLNVSYSPPSQAELHALEASLQQLKESNASQKKRIVEMMSSLMKDLAEIGTAIGSEFKVTLWPWS